MSNNIFEHTSQEELNQTVKLNSQTRWVRATGSFVELIKEQVVEHRKEGLDVFQVTETRR